MMDKKKLFLSNEEEVALSHFNRIHGNKQLQELEKAGFLRGIKRRKTMNVSLKEIEDSLDKQYHDFLKAYGDNDKKMMLRCLADLRNVAGCVFLKLTKEA
jgi:hypothetical protein